MGIKLSRGHWLTGDAVGFAAHWAWIWCVFWSRLFYNEGQGIETLALSPATMLEPLWVVSLGANVATLLVLFSVSRRRNPLFLVRWLPAAAGLLTAMGTLCISLAVEWVPPRWTSSLYLTGSLMTGVGSAVVVTLWAERFVSFGPRRLVQGFVAAVAVAVVCYAVLLVLPGGFTCIIVAGLPLVGMGIYMVQGRKAPRVPLAFRNMRPLGRLPWVMILIAFFFGLSFGLMKGLLAPASVGLIDLRDGLNIVAIAGGAVAVYFTMAWLRMDFDHLTYQVALPLMAAGFLFIPLHGVWSVVGTAVHQLGYQYFYIVLWAIWSVLASRENVSAAWIVAAGMAAIQGGQFVGSLGADFALSHISGDTGKALLSAVSIFFMLLVSLFVFGNRPANTGWGYVRPMDAGDAETVDLGQACDSLARRFRLTPRESDVFQLLARGRNRAYIRKELVIGDETVKSHIKSIYRKFDVHSQQELINVVEEERAEES